MEFQVIAYPRVARLCTGFLELSVIGPGLTRSNAER